MFYRSTGEYSGNYIMDAFNFIINILFTGCYFPFRWLPPIWGITWISLITGIIMLFIYKIVSNQDGIVEVKKQIHARIFEVRLFQDNLSLIKKAIKEIFIYNLKYMYYALKPLAVMLIPVLIILIQLNFRVGYAPLETGESYNLVIKMKEFSGDKLPEIELEAPAGVQVETPAIRIPETGEVVWRIKAVKEEENTVKFSFNGNNFEKSGSGIKFLP